MRQSKLFTKILKTIPRDETSFNAQVLMRAGFIDKLTAGVYSFLPLGLLVCSKICSIIREEMNLIEAQEILMPALNSRENWDITGRWDTLDVLFKLKGAGDKDYALGATHEEIVTPLVKKFVFSYRELPVYTYQIQTKFRNEVRSKSGILRGREFLMKDLYSFHTSQSDLDSYYERVKVAYFKVFERCGIVNKTYLTYASGGTFSKYSHEFQTITEAGEDDIYLCNNCRVAINDEIIIDLNGKCPECGNDKLTKNRAVEVGNIFKLGNKYSSSFDFKYKDEGGKDNDVIMGCYGIGPSRLMGTVVELSHDDRGIIWPEEIAPFKIHLISISKNVEEEGYITANELYKFLLAEGIDVLWDDRVDVRAGEKFAESDLIGCPFRVVVSEKTLASKSVEIKKRSNGDISFMGIDEFKKFVLNKNDR